MNELEIDIANLRSLAIDMCCHVVMIPGGAEYSIKLDRSGLRYRKFIDKHGNLWGQFQIDENTWSGEYRI